MKVYDYTDKTFWSKLERFAEAAGDSEAIEATVATVLKDVRDRGDKAVLEYTAKFDKAELKPSQLSVSDAELKEASKSLTTEQKTAMREAIACVSDFHKQTIPKSWTGKNPHGATVGERFFPIQRVGIYVPGGSVPLVSSVIMSCVLAKIAKVPEIVVATPPGANGKVNSSLLAALHMCGVSEVYRVGGAQAIAALAYGTKTIPAVNKVFGPGNAYVTEAKRQVFGTVGVDLLPGPSEVMVITDDSAKLKYVAADLLAQAEHGSGKEKVYCVTSSKRIAEGLEAELKRHVETLSHADKLRAIMKKAILLIKVPGIPEAVQVANFVAPEHLELHAETIGLSALQKGITTAGAMLIGEMTPTVLGDFTAGPSHTLPTNRTGQFFSGLRLEDFMRRTSIVKYNRKQIEKARDTVAIFAAMEHLDAHGRSLELRFGDE